MILVVDDEPLVRLTIGNAFYRGNSISRWLTQVFEERPWLSLIAG
jgi:hypothetical protein